MEQKKIGTFIAACRRERKMTQMQFAEKLGVTNKAVSKWETGKCMPDASLFDDICLLLDISINELFAGERILSDDIPKKSEENLKNMELEYQSKDKKIVLCEYCSILLTFVAISINLNVGGIWFEGIPVFSNLLVLVLLMVSWSLFLCWTQEDIYTQKITAKISTIILLLSIAGFVLTFWDIRGDIVHLIGFPCEVIFYGLRLIFDWIRIYLVVAVLAFIGLTYSKKNIDRTNQK
ncbi:MAG: helix-turn-helix domain-containing protein [Lachnospiraceae bacterium]|nr:helix-turn-helix domain-containing protein [Lachnospiraceae bacterium]